MAYELICAVFSLYGACLAVGVLVAWLTCRQRKRAAAEAQTMSEAACALRVEELMRRVR